MNNGNEAIKNNTFQAQFGLIKYVNTYVLSDLHAADENGFGTDVRAECKPTFVMRAELANPGEGQASIYRFKVPCGKWEFVDAFIIKTGDNGAGDDEASIRYVAEEGEGLLAACALFPLSGKAEPQVVRATELKSIIFDSETFQSEIILQVVSDTGDAGCKFVITLSPI
jgi:hypothetical protein